MKRFAAILAAFFIAAAVTGCCPGDKQESYTTSKPVLYLYPETTTEVSVKLDYQGTLTTTYPAYNNGWVVTAEPDGTLTSDGREYSYLFWEGVDTAAYDFSQGFCVAGDDTAAFLAVTGPFIDPALIYPGYAYPDGTFQCDGGWTAADGVERGFQFRRTAKGVFDEVYLNIGDANAYRQWVYETAEGVSLLLAERVDGSHALILADRPESFVAVNILGTEDPLSREDLEAFAEGIDFSLL